MAIGSTPLAWIGGAMKFDGYVVSDQGAIHDPAQAIKAGCDLEDRNAVLAFQKPFAEKALARRDGLDVKYAEILRDLKFQALLSDERMASLISVLGVPKGLMDKARLVGEL